MVNGPLIGKIQNQGTYLVQLFSPFGPGFGGADSGTNPDMTLSFGLPLVVGLLLVLYCLLRRESWHDRDTLHRMQAAFGFAVLATVLSMHVFPWDSFHNWLGRTVGKLIGLFQYPWRFLSLATVLLCLAVVLAVQLLKEKEPPPGKGCGPVAGGMHPVDDRRNADPDADRPAGGCL